MPAPTSKPMISKTHSACSRSRGMNFCGGGRGTAGYSRWPNLMQVGVISRACPGSRWLVRGRLGTLLPVVDDPADADPDNNNPYYPELFAPLTPVMLSRPTPRAARLRARNSRLRTCHEGDPSSAFGTFSPLRRGEGSWCVLIASRAHRYLNWFLARVFHRDPSPPTPPPAQDDRLGSLRFLHTVSG